MDKLFGNAGFPWPGAVLSNALPAVIAHLLRDETWARQRLAPHAGKTAHIVVTPIVVRLTVTPEGSVMQARQAAQATLTEPAQDAVDDVDIEDDAAVRIDLPLSSVLSVMADASGESRAALMRAARVSGDAEFAQAISQVAQYLRWDVEEDLSRVVGDVAARRMVSLGRGVVGQARMAHQRGWENVAEYLADEAPVLVRPHAVDALADALRVLRDDLARLEQRVARL